MSRYPQNITRRPTRECPVRVQMPHAEPCAACRAGARDRLVAVGIAADAVMVLRDAERVAGEPRIEAPLRAHYKEVFESHDCPATFSDLDTHYKDRRTARRIAHRPRWNVSQEATPAIVSKMNCSIAVTSYAAMSCAANCSPWTMPSRRDLWISARQMSCAISLMLALMRSRVSRMLCRNSSCT